MNSPEITGMLYSLTQWIYYPLVDLYYTLVYVISYTNKIWILKHYFVKVLHKQHIYSSSQMS